MIEYAKINDFIVCSDGKHSGFYVCDRSMEKVSPIKFDTAYEAIEWANQNYKGVLNETTSID